MDSNKHLVDNVGKQTNGSKVSLVPNVGFKVCMAV